MQLIQILKLHPLALLIASLFVAAYWVTRLASLTSLPIFNDEAQYLHWVLLMTRDISNLWVTLKADNNKPLFFWLIALVFKLFDDPLLAGRCVSAVAGFFSIFGVYLIARRLHSQLAGVVASLLCIVSPWHLFFNRLAHKASLLNCFFIWVIWFTIKLLHDGKKFSGKYCGLMAGTVGLSLLTESTAVLFVFIPLLFKLVYFKDENIPTWGSLIKVFLAGTLIGAFPYLYLYSTDASFQVNNIFVPKVHGLSQMDTTGFILGIPRTAWGSASEVIRYFVVYLTWPVLLLSAGWFAAGLYKHNRSSFVLFVFFVLPLIVLMGTAGRGYSRYYLFCSTPLLIGAALGLAEVAVLSKRAFANKYGQGMAVLIMGPLILLPSARFDYNFLVRPESAGLVASDRYQYVTGEFSGYGVASAVEYLKSEAKEKKIVLFTTQNWGNPEDAMYVYFSSHPNISVYMAPWVTDSPLLPPNATAFKIHEKYTDRFLKRVPIGEMGNVYFICKSTTCPREVFLRNNSNFQLAKVFGKPEGIHFYEIYKSVRAGN